MKKLRSQLPSCVSVRYTPHNEFRITLRISHIMFLRTDWSLQQAIAKAESLAAYVDRTDDEHDWLEVKAIAEELAKIKELDDELVL